MEEKMSRKNYSDVEEKFLAHGLLYAVDSGINRAELSDYFQPILNRSKKGIELKLSSIARELKLPSPRTGKRKEKVEKNKPFIQSVKSNTQIIQSHMPSMELTSFTPDDIGNRVKVKPLNFKPYGVFCVSEEGKTGLLLKGMISTDYVTEISDYIQVGDEFWVIVVPDRNDPNKTLLNAKIIGNIIPIKDRQN